MVEEVLQNIKRGFLTGFSNRKRTLSTLSLSIFLFLIMAFATDAPWHLQTLEQGLSFWDDAFLNAVASMRIKGSYSVPLNTVYALLSGAVLTSFGANLSAGEFRGGELGSLIPGFVATGCASCGVGLTGFIGLAGVAASLPFNGLFVKFAGLSLLIYALYSFGKPDRCVIDAS